MDAKLSTIYYSPQGYWKDIATIKTLAAAAKVSEMADTPSPSANLHAPKHIARPKFDVPTPKAGHQADLLFLLHDRVGRGRNRKTYKYALTVVDVASRFKEAELLTSKE